MKSVILFSLLFLISSNMVQSQLQMDILNLRMSGITPTPPDTIVENGDTIIKVTEGGYVVPFITVKVRLRNISDSSVVIKLNEGSVIMTYNCNFEHYTTKLDRRDLSIDEIKLNNGEDFIFEARGFFLVRNFLKKNEGKYTEFENYSHLINQISPTFKFYYKDDKNNLKIINNEILSVTL